MATLTAKDKMHGLVGLALLGTIVSIYFDLKRTVKIAEIADFEKKLEANSFNTLLHLSKCLEMFESGVCHAALKKRALPDDDALVQQCAKFTYTTGEVKDIQYYKCMELLNKFTNSNNDILSSEPMPAPEHTSEGIPTSFVALNPELESNPEPASNPQPEPQALSVQSMEQAPQFSEVTEPAASPSSYPYSQEPDAVIPEPLASSYVFDAPSPLPDVAPTPAPELMPEPTPEYYI